LISFRPVVAADAARMLKWVSHPEIRTNLGLLNEPDLDKTLAWISTASHSKEVRAFAIEFDGIHVGNVVLDLINSINSSARLSIYIGESSARGRGIGVHSVNHALRVAFCDLKLNKVWLRVHCQNVAAISVYIKCGFAVEGVLRREFAVRGGLIDCLHMGILAEEFKSEH
jgi:RimJ/RimL family protein N-acetyltransferase